VCRQIAWHPLGEFVVVRLNSRVHPCPWSRDRLRQFGLEPKDAAEASSMVAAFRSAEAIETLTFGAALDRGFIDRISEGGRIKPHAIWAHRLTAKGDRRPHRRSRRCDSRQNACPFEHRALGAREGSAPAARASRNVRAHDLPEWIVDLRHRKIS
jgi:hypothetical protein